MCKHREPPLFKLLIRRAFRYNLPMGITNASKTEDWFDVELGQIGLLVYMCIYIGGCDRIREVKHSLTQTNICWYSKLVKYTRLLAPLFQTAYETRHINLVPSVSTLWHGIKSLLTPAFNERKTPPINLSNGFSFENLIVTHRYSFWRPLKILIALK